QVFGEIGTRYFMKDGLGIAAGLHEFARQAEMYFMANYAQTVNVIGAIKTSKTAAQMETTGLALELYRKHFGNIAVQTENNNPMLDVQAALIADGVEYSKTGVDFTFGLMNNQGKGLKRTLSFEWPPFGKTESKPVGVSGLAVGIVNMSDKAEAVKLDIAGFDLVGKKVRQFVIADPENDPQGFNDPDKPLRISIVETALESFNGSVNVKPFSITVVKIE
ncbi:MAG: hypothetical protein FWE67_12180, partial [Planctomycetaceae bacterium]|nr:hypothetical protein [Planctomycetaceae bacterium]